MSSDAERRHGDDWSVGTYDDLCAVASTYLRREGREHTLPAAAVVHEVYLRLTRSPSGRPESRTRFLANASRAMRQVLVDHARRRNADKRGRSWRRVTLTEELGAREHDRVDVLALDLALERLGREHERAARIVELRFFGGMEEREVADELGLSRTAVQGEWRFARAWLLRELGDV